MVAWLISGKGHLSDCGGKIARFLECRQDETSGDGLAAAEQPFAPFRPRPQRGRRRAGRRSLPFRAWAEVHETGAIEFGCKKDRPCSVSGSSSQARAERRHTTTRLPGSASGNSVLCAQARTRRELSKRSQIRKSFAPAEAGRRPCRALLRLSNSMSMFAFCMVCEKFRLVPEMTSARRC